jgi:hypothetical protein
LQGSTKSRPTRRQTRFLGVAPTGCPARQGVTSCCADSSYLASSWVAKVCRPYALEFDPQRSGAVVTRPFHRILFTGPLRDGEWQRLSGAPAVELPTALNLGSAFFPNLKQIVRVRVLPTNTTRLATRGVQTAAGPKVIASRVVPHARGTFLPCWARSAPEQSESGYRLARQFRLRRKVGLLSAGRRRLVPTMAPVDTETPAHQALPATWLPV